MMSRLSLAALLIAVLLSAGCNLKLNQTNKRLARWQSMQEDQADPQKMYDFARETLLRFLNDPKLQRSQEAVITQQVRLNLHRELTPLQMYLMSWYARQALDAVDGADPDWEKGRMEWVLADSVAAGNIPGQQTAYKMVYIQEGYDELVQELILHPEEYSQMTRDFPGLISALREMSRFKYLEAENLLAAGQRDKAIDSYLKVFTMDPENFPPADKLVRGFTGIGIREIVIRRFYRQRYSQSYENDRYEIFTTASGQINQIIENQGEEAADSMMYDVMTRVSGNFNISPEQAMDMYYTVQTIQNGNFPEYARMYRFQVLDGQKPLRQPFAE